MGAKGISIKVRAKKPDTKKIVSIDDTEVFMDRVLSSPVGITRFQEILNKELDRGIRIREKQRNAVYNAITKSSKVTPRTDSPAIDTSQV